MKLRGKFLVATALIVAAAGFAQTNSSAPPAPPPTPPLRSPVDTFRELLSMSASERGKAMSNRPPEARQRLLEKIVQYQSLNPNERELRLRATELRWWLLVLMRQPATNHTAMLAMVPEDLRKLIKDRVDVWNLIPPPLQKEFLDNEDIRRLYEQIQTLPSAEREKILKSPQHQPSLQTGLERWSQMSELEREQICERFKRFFELTARERGKILSTISEAERRLMEQTLKSFESLPSSQRQVCVKSFEKFAGMSLGERMQFLKRAEQWEKMPPGERQAWRTLVNTVTNLPPLPSDFYENTPPPLPPGFRQRTRPAFTNDG